MSAVRCLDEKDVRELEWVADVLEAGASGAQPTQGYERAARDLAGVIRSKLPEPVVTFQPGDTVQRKGSRVRFLVLEGNQHVALANHTLCGCAAGNSQFTSDRYEKVTA